MNEPVSRSMAEWKDTGMTTLPETWQVMSVDEIKAIGKKSIISGPFGSNISSKYFVEDGVPVVRGNNLSLGIGVKFKDNGFAYITQEKANELNTWATKNDLIFTAVGTIGQVGLLTGSEKYEKYIISNKQLRLTLNSDIVTPLFAYYWFASDIMVDQIMQRNTGSSVPLINLSVLKSLFIPIPPATEQKAIATVLSSLDDKIDLLHRQNQTLEAMTATLFRQWFVEPARAGEPHAGGEVQEDWEEVPLEQFFDFMEGPGIRNWQYTESGTPFINIRLISNGDIDISKASFVSNDEANGKYSHFHLKEGDMIVSTSGTLGKNAIVRNYHLPLILNTSVIRFRPRDGRSHSFVYQYLNSKLFQEHLVSAASGSVQANFGPTHLKQMTLSKPPQEILDKYLVQADRLYEKQKLNQAQIKTLEKLRDNLLPKLMSGEVRVQCEAVL